MTEGSGFRICFVCTHSLTLATLYKGLFPYLLSKGWHVTAIVGDTNFDHIVDIVDRVRGADLPANLHSVVSNLVYAAKASDVVATIVVILSIIPVWLAQRLSSDPVGVTGAR